MRHIPLPGLTLAVGVILAAVLALLALKGSDAGDPGARMPPEQGGTVRLKPGGDASQAQYVAGAAIGAVLGESAGHEAGRSGAER
jgi:hypothetical protein